MALFDARTDIHDESVTLGEGAISAKDHGVVTKTNIINSGGFAMSALAAFGLVLYFARGK